MAIPLKNKEKQENVAYLVSQITSGEFDHLCHVKTAMGRIAELVCSRNQSDRDSGLDSLYVLTRYIEQTR